MMESRRRGVHGTSGEGEYVELEVLEEGERPTSSSTSGIHAALSQDGRPVTGPRATRWSTSSLVLLGFGISLCSFLFGSAWRSVSSSDPYLQNHDVSDPAHLSLPSTYKKPLVIGHRGSCGMLPEHTLEGYKLAIKQEADCIECDVILTKDAVAICRHDLTLESTTDVANRTEFAHMRTTRMVEGEEVTGWFAVDFTVAQIKTLRAKQRMDFRDPNYNGLFEVATLQEQIDLVKAGKGDGDDVVEEESERVRWHLRLLDWFLGARGGGSDLGKAGATEKSTTCLYPEMKSTAWHNSLGLWGGRRSEDIILEVLRKNGYSSKDDDIYLQSFETEDLLHVHSRSSIKLIQLIGAPDVIQWDTKRPYSELLSEKGMHEIAGYAFAVSPSKNDICPKNETTGYIDEASIQKGKAFIDMVHSKGLQAHPWVLRDENRYLAWNYGQDAYNEYTLFIKEVGVDGFFTDFPQTASNYIRLFEMDLRQQTRLP